MWKIQLRKKEDVVELLELRPNLLAYNVQKELVFYGISVQIDGECIKKALNDVIDIDWEKVEKAENTRGRVCIRKGWRGEYSSRKNIRLHVTDFLKWGFELAPLDGKGRLLMCVSILLELSKQLKIKLGKNETVVCVALYRLAKHHVLTDDNVIAYIMQEMQESSYSGLMDEERINESLLTLVNIGIISIEDGRYEVAQEVLFLEH